MIPQLCITVLGLVLFSSITYAQMPCEPRQMLVFDNKKHICPMHDPKGNCNKLMFVITGFANASHIGAHISTTNKLGKGDEAIDCHIQTRKGFSSLRCREIKKSDSAETYELDLGLRRDIDSVMMAISRCMIKITVNKHSTTYVQNKNKSTMSKTAKIPYSVDAVFPVSCAKGFCSKSRVHFKANGAMYKLKKDGQFKGGKDGSNYRISAYVAPF